MKFSDGATDMTDTANYYLDICTEQCPMTFVRTKLRLERMQVGEILEVRLTGAEPLLNVPKSVLELGHQIIGMEAEDAQDEYGIHRLLIKKTK